jgi:hypothetical protein
MVDTYRNGNGHSSFSNVPLFALDPGKLRGFTPLIHSLAKRFDELDLVTAQEQREIERELDELKSLDQWAREVAVRIRTKIDLIEAHHGPLSNTSVYGRDARVRPLTSRRA